MYKRERLNRIIKTSLSVLCGVLLFILSTGHANAEDNCPDDPNKTEPGICGCGIPDTDTDSDGTPDCSDTDDDNDGVPDVSDAFPRYPSETLDSDGDGWGDNQDQVPDDNRFSQPNILQNPGAESGSENWSLGDAGGDGEIKADAAHTGTKSFFLTSTGGDTGDIRWQSDDYAMPAGVRTYHFRGWMKTDSTTRTRIQAVPTIGGSKSYRAIDAANGTNDWAFYSDTKTETGDITSFQFRLIQGGTTDGQLGWFDDLALFTVIPGDNDSDTIQDNIDPDDDNDGVKDGADAFPLDDSESRDTDGDGTGNNADTDDDGDGIPDVSDSYPLDNTRPVNTAPTISDITNQTTPEGTALGPLGFTIGDDLTAVGDLTVSAVSNNQTLVPNDNITPGGSDANRTITLTPATGAFGTATITVTVNDGNLTANDTFDVTVTSVDNPPTISAIADQETFKNNFIAPLDFTIGDDLTAVGDLTVSAVSNNQTLIPDANFILDGSDANRTVKITPAAGETGTATITITVNDGTLSTDSDFDVDVLTDVITSAGLSPALWLDARDTNTIIHSSNVISQWSDKSGNGNHAAQDVQALQPTYDDVNGVIQFSGSILEAPHIPYGDGNKVSVYVVTRPDTCLSDTRWIITKGLYASSMGYSLAQYCNDFGGKFMATVTGQSPRGFATDGNTHLAAQIVDGTNNELWVNGALIESVTGLDFDVTGAGNKAYKDTIPVRIGGVSGKNLTGDIGEVLIFQENLSDLNKAKLEGYLAKKWALRGNLPDDHPFKTQDFGVLPGQSLSVAENAANGTALGTLQGISFAGDHDFTNWGIVVVKTIYQNIFSITVDGEIRIADNTELDFEKTKRHIMTVRVYDNLAKAWSDPVEVEINVTDVSDGQTKDYSLLWGVNGELWDPNGRLPDYSYAGYHAENADIPDITVRVTVTDAPYNADNSGATDASDAVQDAVDAIAAAIDATTYTTGTVHLPAGTYKFEHPVFVRTSGIVIRGDVDGEGNPNTNIYSPYSAEDAMNIVDGIAGIRSVEELQEKWDLTTTSSPHTAGVGQMIRFEGSGSTTFLSNITANAQHGDHTLTVSNGGNFTAGMVVVLEMTDTEHFGPLWQNNHNNQISTWDDTSCTWAKGGGSWTFWVESVSGNTVTLREPLPLDVHTDWTPKLKEIEVLTEVGVENRRMEFFDPGILQPHLEEVGYNGVGFSLVINSWAQNLEFHDADNGVTVGDKSAWVTVSDVSFSGRQGHHGISINGATHCLVKDIYFESDDRLPQTGGDGVDDSWHHAITYTHKAALNVAMNISSGGDQPPLYLDYHRNGPMANLFTQVNSPWAHGSAGDKCAGPNGAARNTFWNLHGQAGEVEGAPGLNWGHIQTNVVTVLSVEEQLTSDRKWYEDVDNLQPANIYLAQLAKRISLEDQCPDDPAKSEAGICGCGVADTDSDNDGTPDCNDNCPNDPDKTEPGTCGCGVADTDSDSDGTADCNDNCDDDPAKVNPGTCGCGVSDADADGDGTPDCNDGCPDDSDKTAPGVCGCGVSDTDTDNDGTPDCNDGCPDDSDKTAPGVCGCGVSDTDLNNDGTIDCANSAPFFAGALADEVRNEDFSTFGVMFGVDDDNNDQLTVTAVSSNTAIVTVAPQWNNPLVLNDYDGKSLQLNLISVADASGSALITITLTDSGGLSDSESFTITVNPINDTPVTAYVCSDNLCGGKTPCFTTIGEAIVGLPGPDMVQVCEGVYNEEIVIDGGKEITIEGGWEKTFKEKGGPTTSINNPVVKSGAGKFLNLKIIP